MIELSPTEMANLLLEALRDKKKVYGAQMGDVVLALDATDHHASFAAGPVISIFRSRYAGEARLAGFESVWIVGPLHAERLDQ
jgi:hypothetical protein